MTVNDRSLIDSNADLARPTNYQPPSRKALWGLYSVYVCIGIVYGFFAANLSGTLICHYYFGPFGKPDGTSGAQCVLGSSLFSFPWSLKVFIALLIDNFKIMGSRKRWWIIGGWAAALGLLAVSAVLVPSFAKGDHHNTYTSYVLIMTAVNIFIAFADVAADGMGVAYTKLEPDDQRGGVIATNYQCRFVATALSGGVIKFIFMNGPQFADPTDPEAHTQFSWGLDLASVHWLLFGLAVPFFICMFLWIEDPPLAKEDEHSTGCKGVSETLAVMWKATQSYAVFNMVIFAIGIQSIGQLMSPSDQAVQDIASPDGTQLSVGTILSYGTMMVGIQIYKRYFLNSNQRMISMWCYSVAAVLQLAELAIIYKGVTMAPAVSGWFYVIQGDIPQIMTAIAFCLLQITVAEIAPVGMEASTYEFLLTASNISITIGQIVTTMMQDWLKVGDISGEDFHAAYLLPDQSTYHSMQNRMAIGAWITAALSVLAAIFFSLSLPAGTQQCRDWAGAKSWQVPSVSAMNFGIVSFMIVWSLEKVFLRLLGISPDWAVTLNTVLAAVVFVYALGGVGHRLYSISQGFPQKEVAPIEEPTKQ